MDAPASSKTLPAMRSLPLGVVLATALILGSSPLLFDSVRAAEKGSRNTVRVSVATALAAASAQTFGEKTPEERAHGPKRRGRFKSLPSGKRDLLLKRLRHFKQLPPEQQQELRRKFQRYRSLTPEQQRRLHKKQRDFSSLPPAKKQELRRLWRRLQQLPPEERRRLLDKLKRFRGLSGEEKRIIREKLRSSRRQRKNKDRAGVAGEPSGLSSSGDGSGR